jgi:hypothetical protein
MLEPEELETLVDARPFKPFALRTADGHEYPVYRPHAISWGEDSPSLVTIHLRRAVRALVDLTLVTAAVELAVPPVELP